MESESRGAARSQEGGAGTPVDLQVVSLPFSPLSLSHPIHFLCRPPAGHEGGMDTGEVYYARLRVKAVIPTPAPCWESFTFHM